MPRPFGLISTKPAVLGTANESKATILLLYIKLNCGWSVP